MWAGKQQIEPASGLQLGIKTLQQLGLGGLIEPPIRHGADQLETEGQCRTDRQARLSEQAGLGGAEPFDGGGVSRVSARERNLPCSGWLTKVSW